VSALLSSRRDFLKAAGGAATVPLIGTALIEAAYRPTQVAALKGFGQIRHHSDS
jgi:hypothetical protein